MKYLLIIFLLFCISCRQEPHTKAKTEVVVSGCIADIEYLQGTFYNLPKICIKFQDGRIRIVNWEDSLECTLRIGSCGKLYQRQDSEYWSGYVSMWEEDN